MSGEIHKQIKAIAGDLPAAYISQNYITSFVVVPFKAMLESMLGRSIPAGQQQLDGRLDSYKFKTSGKPSGFVPLPVPPSHHPKSSIGFLLGDNLEAEIHIHISNDSSKIVSSVFLEFSNMIIRLDAASNQIILEGADFKIDYRIEDDPNAKKHLADAGVDPVEARRIEGLIAYSVLPAAISENLGQRRELDLGSYFPVFDFGTYIALTPIVDTTVLAIVPEGGYSINENAACDCADGPSLGIDEGGVSPPKKIPADPKVGDELGGVTIGGPLPEGIDPMKDLGPRTDGEGGLGLYLPANVQKELFVEVMPAINIRARDNGFIGFDARGSVGFTDFDLNIDAANGGVRLRIKMDISASAVCTLDMGCGIRAPIGHAIIQPTGSDAFLEMGFYAVIESGSIKVRSTLHQFDAGNYIAVVVGIGTALKIIGVTAWIGFLIDVVLAAIVTNGLPIALRSAIKKYLGGKEWQLIDFDSVLSKSPNKYFPPVEHHNVDGDSLLTSVEFLG